MSEEKIRIPVALLSTAGVGSSSQLVDTTQSEPFVTSRTNTTSTIELQRTIYFPSFIKHSEERAASSEVWDIVRDSATGRLKKIVVL